MLSVLKKLLRKYQELPKQVKAALWFAVCSFLQKGISIITTPIFTRLLSVAAYGQYIAFDSWLVILTVFITLKLTATVFTSGLVRFEERRDEFVSAMQGLCLTLVLLWTVIYVCFFKFWNQLFGLTTVQMLCMLVMIWSTAVFTFWSWEQRVEFKYRNLVIMTLVVSIAKPAVGILFVQLAADKVTARILGLALVELIFYTGFFFVQMQRGKKFFVKDIWTHAMCFSIPLIPHYLSASVLSSADRIMIKNMVGTDAAGIYGLAYSISLAMTLFSTALTQTIEPWIFKKIKAKKVSDIARIAYAALIVIAGCNIMLIALAPEVVAAFAPIEYQDAIWIIPPVSMSVFYMFAYTLFTLFEFYYEKPGYVAVSTMAAAVLNIILNYLFIPIFGYYAAGYTTLACYIVFAVMHYLFMQKLCRDNLAGEKVYSIKIMLIIAGCFMGMGFIFCITYRRIFIRYGLLVLVIILITVFRKKIMNMVRDILAVRQKK